MSEERYCNNCKQLVAAGVFLAFDFIACDFGVGMWCNIF
jgi:hypothetical protein